jgi:hypothetical protein
MHGAYYLHADEDGVGVSLRPRCASLNTAWRVHRVRRRGDGYVLLHGAAYGRYLALSPQRVSLVYAGHAAVQGAFDAPEQVDYRWPYGPPSPARPEHDAAQARSGPARRGPTDFVLVLGGTMG